MRISVKEASKMTGATQEYIRYGLRSGTLPIGSAVKMSTRWTYNIQLEKVQAYIGKENTNGNNT